MAINATSYPLWRSAPSTEPSMDFILTHLLTTFSKDILILTTSKPTYKLSASLNAAFCQLYFQSFTLKVPSTVQNHQFGSFSVVCAVVYWLLLLHNFVQLSLNSGSAQFKSCSRHVGDSQWCGSLTMVLAGNKAKRLSLVNHTTKTIHHHHHHHQPMLLQIYRCCILKFALHNKH